MENKNQTIQKIVLNLTMVLALCLSHSCVNQTKEKKSQPQTEMEDSKSSSVQLNNGNLWIANPETTTGIETMLSIMNSFDKIEDINAHKKLSKQLNLEFSTIFRKCTMTGEAHNQLHNFLLPIKDLLGSLDSPDLKECQQIYNKLNNELKNYTTYFE